MSQSTQRDAYDEQTCGKGLAQHSDLPAKLGELTVAVADVLEHHMTALDLSDERSRKEHAAYRRLVADHRKAGAELRAIADAMAGYRDLPMGKHNMAAMATPDAARVFSKLVRLEEELFVLLRGRLGEHRAMLGEMGSPPG
jgi:hypothetical protein